jgi:hypothetical protein
MLDRVVHGDHVRVLQPGPDPRLAPDLPAITRLRPLERDDPPQLQIGGPPHDAHAPGAELFLQAVPPRDQSVPHRERTLLKVTW